jgi:hypothetical protein
MKTYRADSTAGFAPLLAAAALIFLATDSLQAQIMPRQSTASAASTRAANVAERDQRQREWNMRNLDIQRGPTEEERRAARQQQQLILAQITKDFRLIQQLNNSVVSIASTPASTLDYKLIARSTGEINRRASRLQQYLALPRIDDAEQSRKSPATAQIAELKPLLHILDTRVASFVNSPFFTNPGVLDAELSTKASRDLKGIIELSADIKKHADRLHKTLNNSQ